MTKTTLYQRLGGYDAICAVTNDLLPRLQADPQLARYWQHRGEDGVKREKQLLIDFLCSSAAGRASAPTFLERFGSEHRRHFGRMRTYKQSPCSARELVNRDLWGMASHLSFTARQRHARSHDVELYSRWLHIG